MKLYNNPHYKINAAKDMSIEEISQWFAFCNAVKFISLHCRKLGKNPDLVELDSRKLSEYVDTVSGDISTNLRERGGIPMKYSLDPTLEESRNVEEVHYT